jgi:hypothetical protein
MTTPGFTAEASLGKTSGRYTLTSGTAVEIESVLPQFSGATDLPTRQVFCIGGHCYEVLIGMTGEVVGGHRIS